MKTKAGFCFNGSLIGVTEIAGVDNVARRCRCGKRGSGQVRCPTLFLRADLSTLAFSAPPS